MANIRFFLDMIKKTFFDNVFYGRGHNIWSGAAL